MVRIFVVLACCAVALAEVLPGPETCGKPQSGRQPSDVWVPGSRIVGGVAAPQNSWPWIGGMVKAQEGYYPYQFCGGTLISANWFVTAGHCVDSISEDEMKRDVKIVLGTNDLAKGMADPRYQYRIKRLVKHFDYDNPYGSTNNDIALVKLARPVTFSKEILPACLPRKPANDSTSYAHKDAQMKNLPAAFVGGWGNTYEGQGARYNADGTPKVGAGSETLQQVNIAVYPDSDCKSKLRGYTFTDKMICGGFEQGGKDSCQGDSGGPLVRMTPTKNWELIGVVSWGAGCARASMPGIYADVFDLIPWINKNINDPANQ